ncbi:MAG: hypothetical protein ABIS92_07440 [Polyangia bacterium]
MEKSSSTALVSLMIPLMAAALSVQACAGAESPKTGGATGGGSASTGGRSGSTGGSSFGTGGSSSTSTGGTASGSGGNSGFGTGGSTGFGTGGGTIIGGGTGGAAVTPGALSIMSGFATNGSWKGYAYTGAFGTSATIAPVCPAPCFMATPTTICAMGTVGTDPMSASGALLGWNVNQAMATTADSPPILTVATAGTGLAITLSAPVTGGRVQIQDGAMPPKQWCANLTGASAMIPWSMFRTECWGATGTAFAAGTPISAVQVVIPSNTTAAVPFNFCLNDLHQY